MFNLEQSIAEWRRQMLAAGIKTPVPLEELEEHLREDIEHQMQLGATAQQAFEVAVQSIGQPNAITMEFARNRSIADFLGRDQTTRMNRVLSLLWLAFCMWGFLGLCAWFSKILHISTLGIDGPKHLGIIIPLLNAGLFFVGIFASLSLFRGTVWGRSRIRLISIICVIEVCSQMRQPGSIPASGYILGALGLISAVQLSVPGFFKQTAA